MIAEILQIRNKDGSKKSDSANSCLGKGLLLYLKDRNTITDNQPVPGKIFGFLRYMYAVTLLIKKP